MEQNTLYGYSHEELSAEWSYDPETGKLTSNKHRSEGRFKKLQYHYIYMGNKTVGYKQIYSHRAAWFLHYGTINDSLVIDHINGNRTDNRLCNLRQISIAENLQSFRRNVNATGIPGIRQTASGKFAVFIRGQYYGLHKTIERAEMVAKTMRQKLGMLSAAHA